MPTKNDKARTVRTKQIGKKPDLIHQPKRADIIAGLKSDLARAKEKLAMYEKDGNVAGVRRANRIIQDTTSTLMRLEQQSAR